MECGVYMFSPCLHGSSPDCGFLPQSKDVHFMTSKIHEARLIGGSNTHRCWCLFVFLCVLIMRILTCGWLLMLDSFSFSQFTFASLFKTFMLSWVRGMIRLFDLLLQMFLRCRARPPQFTGKLCVFTPAKSFDANDMLACGGEFAPLSACTTVSILCLHEMDRLIIRHDQRLVISPPHGKSEWDPEAKSISWTLFLKTFPEQVSTLW